MTKLISSPLLRYRLVVCNIGPSEVSSDTPQRRRLVRVHCNLPEPAPPHLSASKLVQYLKGNSSHKLQMEYKELNKEYWGRHLWARGYFVASSGNVTEEVIAEYIKNQDLEERKNNDNFEISGL